MKEKIRNLYMAWLMERVMASGVAKEDSVKKAAEIFMEDFKEFADDFKNELKK